MMMQFVMPLVAFSTAITPVYVAARATTAAANYNVPTTFWDKFAYESGSIALTSEQHVVDSHPLVDELLPDEDVIYDAFEFKPALKIIKKVTINPVNIGRLQPKVYSADFVD